MSKKTFIVDDIPKFVLHLLSALKSPLVVFVTLAGNVIMFLCAAGFYHFENGVNPKVNSYFDALWFALCTVSTVGFGDVTPETTGGRLVGMTLIVSGATLFVSFSAILVSTLMATTSRKIEESELISVKEYENVMRELDRLHSKIDDLANTGNRSSNLK